MCKDWDLILIVATQLIIWLGTHDENQVYVKAAFASFGHDHEIVVEKLLCSREFLTIYVFEEILEIVLDPLNSCNSRKIARCSSGSTTFRRYICQEWLLVRERRDSERSNTYLLNRRLLYHLFLPLVLDV